MMESTNLSLINRLHQGSEQAWAQFDGLYHHFLRSWLRRYSIPPQDAEDLVQEVMAVVVKRFPEFSHFGRPGSFRTWMRNITANVSREFWRRRRKRPIASGDTDFGRILEQLEDPASEISRQWDRHHDQHVIARLLEVVLNDFQEKTRAAFRRHVLEERPATEVAETFGMTVQSVYLAKSRVMRRLREEAQDLSDEFCFLE